jgi:hypothetical protein
MAKITKQQLSFGADFYPQPDSGIRKPEPVSGQPGKAKPYRSGKEPVQASLQPFLPGLSRRGRPRSKNPIAPSVRASESRKRRIGGGVKRIELLLEPAIAADLDALVAHFKVPRVEIISRFVAKAAKRIQVALK